jgi:hypothetical protein
VVVIHRPRPLTAPGPLLALVALLVVLGACGSDDDQVGPTTTEAATTTAGPTTTAAPTTTEAPTTTAPAPPTTSNPFDGPPRWAPPFEPLPAPGGPAPLTGRVLAGELDPSDAVLAVKVDNHPQSRPPTALEDADVVFEEDVEGVTRFVALFHSKQPRTIGPVRSARTSDLPILASMNRPILAWSGGNDYVTRAVENAEDAGVLVDRGEPTFGRCYRRDPGRPRPHNLYVDPVCVRDAAPDAGPARPLWTFGPLPAGMASTPRTSFGVALEGVQVTWTWDAERQRYLRSQNARNHVAASGVRLGAENVVVMTVQYGTSPADRRSPEARTLGSGPVVVHRGGEAVTGTWQRAELTDGFTFVDGAGALIPLSPGVTFVELAPA